MSLPVRNGTTTCLRRRGRLCGGAGESSRSSFLAPLTVSSLEVRRAESLLEIIARVSEQAAAEARDQKKRQEGDPACLLSK